MDRAAAIIETTTEPDLAALVAGRQWYHTIELAPGVVTPGWFDHRDVAHAILPRLLTGARCLDIATFDGFWALEMQSRAAGEVIGVDLTDVTKWDWPYGSGDAAFRAMDDRVAAGDGFELVKRMLSHGIERVEMSVYDLSPDTVGMFDFVFMGSLLLHVRDRVRALQAVRSVCRDELCLMECYDVVTTALHPYKPVAEFDGIGRPWWWRVNHAALKRMTESAGFRQGRRPDFRLLPPGRGRPVYPARWSVFNNRPSRREFFDGRFGDPHVALHLTPR